MAFFFQKLIEIAQRLGALPPDPHSLRRPPDPLCNTFEYTSLLNTSPKLDLHFPTISFRPFSSPKSWLSANELQLQIFHSTISLPHKKFLFCKFLMTSLHAICGLGPPNQKSWLCLWLATPFDLIKTFATTFHLIKFSRLFTVKIISTIRCASVVIIQSKKIITRHWYPMRTKRKHICKHPFLHLLLPLLLRQLQ